MKRKQQESIIRLAFGECASESERRNLEAELSRDELEREVELVATIREGLKQIGQNTPPCHMSVDRIRYAILNQKMREGRGMSAFWSWASVGVAACAFLFVINSNRSAPGEPRLIAGPSMPSIIEQGSPLLGEPESSRVATIWEPSRFGASEAAPEVKRSRDSSSPAEPKVPKRAVQTKDSGDGRPSRTTPAAAARRDALRNSREATLTMSAAAAPGFVDAPEDEPSEPIILINSDTDSDTGAQVATEVQSVENVHIGG